MSERCASVLDVIDAALWPNEQNSMSVNLPNENDFSKGKIIKYLVKLVGAHVVVSTRKNDDCQSPLLTFMILEQLLPL